MPISKRLNFYYDIFILFYEIFIHLCYATLLKAFPEPRRYIPDRNLSIVKSQILYFFVKPSNGSEKNLKSTQDDEARDNFMFFFILRNVSEKKRRALTMTIFFSLFQQR